MAGAAADSGERVGMTGDGALRASDVEQAWLDYARDVVHDSDHRAACAALGGSPSADGFPEDVRWPGALGRTYRPGGVLWVSNIHRNFDSAGVSMSAATDAADLVRRWRDGAIGDALFLEGIRAVYEHGLATWTVGTWPRKVLAALGFSVSDVLYTNAARCQSTGTGEALQRFCLVRFPLTRLVEEMRPGLVLITSSTALTISPSESWPCPVVAFSQRNGRLVLASPWKPPGVDGPVSAAEWIPALASELSTTT